ncbi:MAG: hypothetical protein KZQ72_04025 [Candidatus Thiodiazotropha sp. (ex Cardiolucina cf. quadrata)]|nr:hypothetical protein [Candidatus Thiodiazotropha sp. (ex Cardiolucina cf. quadrata)]
MPRSAWQGMTRRDSQSIPTSYNTARRYAGRALVVVAMFTQWVSLAIVHKHRQTNHSPFTKALNCRF